ncbi:MAG TPA: DUF192 domain-containing protein, partial [Kofleriaceae bacterium]
MHRICCLAIVLACSTGSSTKHDDSASATLPTPVSDSTPKPAAPAAPAAPPSKVTVGDATVTVEIVATEAKIERGLMYRENLPPDAGMLFLMGKEWDWNFWMRNTLIPLDIIFITKGMAVAGVAADAKPLDDSLLGVKAPSLYVLEVNAGWSAAHHV